MNMINPDELMWQRAYFVQAVEKMYRDTSKREGTTAETEGMVKVREILKTLYVPEMPKKWSISDVYAVYSDLMTRYPEEYK